MAVKNRNKRAVYSPTLMRELASTRAMRLLRPLSEVARLDPKSLSVSQSEGSISANAADQAVRKSNHTISAVKTVLNTKQRNNSLMN